MRHVIAMLAALLFAMSLGCEAADKRNPLRNNSGLTLAQLGALLQDVKRADAGGKASACRPTGEVPPSSEKSTWLASSSPDKIIHAFKAPPYASDPRDIELTLDIGRSETWLIVTIRVQRGQCIGYSLSTMYS